MKLTIKDLLALGLFPLFVFILDIIIWQLAPGWAWRWSVDTPLHFLGGLSIATSAAYAYGLLEKTGAIVIRNRMVKIILITAMMALSAVLWEFYEFALDNWFGTHAQASNEDTVKDLIFGLIGGLVGGAFSIRHGSK